MRLYFAWAVALIGTLLSLYFGEISGHTPCTLCWMQRLALFPLVILLGIAAYREDHDIRPYLLPLAAFGFLVALYQSLESHFPILKSPHLCGEASGCLEPLFLLFGFISLPILSAIGFGLILLLLLLPKI